jgi:hypothetical protein
MYVVTVLHSVQVVIRSSVVGHVRTLMLVLIHHCATFLAAPNIGYCFILPSIAVFLNYV